MSTPAGQSDEQPLQDKHRSSESATSAERKPLTRVPFATSCSTRERPRVESLSSRVARYDGHITPAVAVVSARHLPTPTHRCTATDRSPRSCG